MLGCCGGGDGVTVPEGILLREVVISATAFNPSDNPVAGTGWAEAFLAEVVGVIASEAYPEIWSSRINVGYNRPEQFPPPAPTLTRRRTDLPGIFTGSIFTANIVTASGFHIAPNGPDILRSITINLSKFLYLSRGNLRVQYFSEASVTHCEVFPRTDAAGNLLAHTGEVLPDAPQLDKSRPGRDGFGVFVVPVGQAGFAGINPVAC